ncbi:MAG: Na+/H+ antiporter subunit E [Planctomycetota bacterium]
MILGTLLLTLAWCVLTREYTIPNAALGVAIGALLHGVVRKRAQSEAPPARNAWTRIPAAIELLLFFFYELFVSSVRIAVLVARPKLEVKTAVVTVQVDPESEAELATLSNLVTLTPGTLSIDTSPDGKQLYVHVMGVDDLDAVRREIEEGFARRVRKVYR